MTDAATLSRDLALALGYAPESVRVVPTTTMEMRCEVYRLHRYMQDRGHTNIPATWHPFDYRDPTIVLPLIEWLMRKHDCLLVPSIRQKKYGVLRSGTDTCKQVDVWAATLPEAVARAVIAVMEG